MSDSALLCGSHARPLRCALRFRSCREMATNGHDYEKKFLYFAYGSNLHEARLHISCPSAARLAPARLHGYRLTFNYNSLRWRGHVATIREGEKDSLWGCIWLINKEELEKLNLQEGVHQGLYRPFNVEVYTPEGRCVQAITYQMTLPYEDNACPSSVYKHVILTGAIASGLPDDYIEGIKRLPDNGYDGPVEVELNLMYRQDAKRPQTHIKVPNPAAPTDDKKPQNIPKNSAELTAN